MPEPYANEEIQAVFEMGLAGQVLEIVYNRPSANATLAAPAGPVDLTGKTVTIDAWAYDSDGTIKISSGACVVDPDQVTNKGLVRYSFVPADVDTEARYKAVLHVDLLPPTGPFAYSVRDKKRSGVYRP